MLHCNLSQLNRLRHNKIWFLATLQKLLYEQITHNNEPYVAQDYGMGTVK